MTEPVEPVTIDEAKLHARIDGSAEDTLIASYIVAARCWVENYTGHILVQRTVTEWFDRFGCLRLRAWPIADDAEVLVAYTDAFGVSQTFTDYRLDVGDRPAVLQPAFGVSWPYGASGQRSVSATFVAGYAAPEDVPAEMKVAMFLLITHWHENRSAVNVGNITTQLGFSVESLCGPYRLWSV